MRLILSLIKLFLFVSVIFSALHYFELIRPSRKLRKKIRQLKKECRFCGRD